MSEMIDTRKSEIRWQLLVTVSAMTLLGAGKAMAADGDHPWVWIELDGQYAQQTTAEEVYAPPFLLASPFDAAAHANLERAPSTVWDKGAKISFQPEGSDWVLSASARYGKSARAKTINHQTAHASHYKYGQYLGVYDAYQIFNTHSSQDHFVLDFQAGKDVGLGSFGSSGNSTLSVGVRFAQFNAKTNVEIQSQATNINGYGYQPYHIFRADFAAKRRFNGVGPSITWDASANLLGNPSSSTIAFDWGVNGAVLFGRQRVIEHHQTTNNAKQAINYVSITHTSGGAVRNRNVTVPNLGGFAGLSWRTSNAKVSLGYRADFFFGAIDGGIDRAKRENVGFYGPFAAVSVGLGG